MPHVIVKLWPGKSEARKKRLADKITEDVMNVLDYGEESVSVAIEEVKPQDWAEKVYKPDMLGKQQTLYKKPGYNSVEQDIRAGMRPLRQAGNETRDNDSTCSPDQQVRATGSTNLLPRIPFQCLLTLLCLGSPRPI